MMTVTPEARVIATAFRKWGFHAWWGLAFMGSVLHWSPSQAGIARALALVLMVWAQGCLVMTLWSLVLVARNAAARALWAGLCLATIGLTAWLVAHSR